MAAAPRVTWRSADDSEDEEMQDFAGMKMASKTALLLVIDSTPDMFDTPWGENEDTPFRAALKYCVSTCRSKIVSSPRDLVAIMFAGTEKDQNPPAFPNFFIMYPLALLKVEVIEQLQKMATEEDYDGFEERIGSSPNSSLKDMFWLSKIIYENSKAGKVNQKLIYFTCEDNPHARNRNLRNDSIQKFKDLGAVEFNIVTFKEDFMHDHFYKSLFPEPNRITYPEDLKSLRQIVRFRQKTNRPISRLTLQIYKGIHIAVGVYSFARSALPPRKVNVNERNNELVTKTINTFRSDTGTTVLKSEQVKVASIGGEMVAFEKDELHAAKLSGSTGIRIMGYIPRETFDQYLIYRKEGYFLYPDEERIVGSTELFTVLLRRCHALGKIAVAKLVLTRGRTAKLACLVPSVEPAAVTGRSVTGTRGSPCSGFYVCLLPFADELRTHDLPPGREASDELVAQMEKIVKKTSRKDFDLSSVQNPFLQLKYRQIETIALEGGDSQGFEEEPFEDFTEPNDDAMHSRIGSVCEEFNSTAENDHARKKATAVVRPAAPPRQVNMAMEAKHRRLDKLTCAVLSEFLLSQGIAAKGKTKPKLIQMIYDHFEGEED